MQSCCVVRRLCPAAVQAIGLGLSARTLGADCEKHIAFAQLLFRPSGDAAARIPFHRKRRRRRRWRNHEMRYSLLQARSTSTSTDASVASTGRKLRVLARLPAYGVQRRARRATPAWRWHQVVFLLRAASASDKETGRPKRATQLAWAHHPDL